MNIVVGKEDKDIQMIRKEIEGELSRIDLVFDEYEGEQSFSHGVDVGWQEALMWVESMLKEV